MRVTILAYGSRGDIQPFIPLSQALMEAGHVVKIAAPARFRTLVGERHIRFAPLTGDPADLSRQLNDAGHNFLKMLRALMDHAVEIGVDVLRQTESACEDADLLIHSFTHLVGAHTLARERNLPDVHVQLFPMFAPTGDYPNVTLPPLGSPAVNRLSHMLTQRITWWTSRIGFERVRRQAGLPQRRLYWPFSDDPLRPRTPILCAWSPRVLPASADWPPHVHITGYLFGSGGEGYQPPGHLLSFLGTGEAPICITFGSMVHRDRGRIGRIVHAALEQTRQRAVVLSGWGGVEGYASNRVLHVEEVPHDWLLPRCRFVIHHGGAGTTAAGLRAGIPAVVIPFTADQPFWGRRVHALGAGPAPIRVGRLTVEGLVGAIREAESQAIQERARSLGALIRGEDGVTKAVELIEAHAATFRTKR